MMPFESQSEAKRFFVEKIVAQAAAEAREVLEQGDHYVLIMIERGLGTHLRPWWAFWR